MTRLEDYDTAERFSATVKETALLTPENYGDEIRNIVLETSEPRFAHRPARSSA